MDNRKLDVGAIVAAAQNGDVGGILAGVGLRGMDNRGMDNRQEELSPEVPVPVCVDEDLQVIECPQPDDDDRPGEYRKAVNLVKQKGARRQFDDFWSIVDQANQMATQVPWDQIASGVGQAIQAGGQIAVAAGADPSVASIVNGAAAVAKGSIEATGAGVQGDWAAMMNDITAGLSGGAQIAKGVSGLVQAQQAQARARSPFQKLQRELSRK